MNKLSLFAAALLAVSATPAMAQQQGIQLIVNFDGPQVTQTLTEMGATAERRTNDAGTPYYAITFRNGAKALAYPSVCNGAQPNTGCTGLRLWANFTKPANLTVADVAKKVNDYNIGHAATMTSYSENGDAQLNMYLIADNGIAIANMKTKLQVFEASAATFSQAIYNQ